MTQDSDNPQFFYNGIADSFDSLHNPYDVARRLEIVFRRCLKDRDLTGRLVLDGGCGSGEFSRMARLRGATVVACDIGERLVRMALAKAKCHGVNADAARLPFLDNRFDGVISSEMIEHTPLPKVVIHELTRVLKPKGFFVLTTPNRVWQPIVRLAGRLHLRPYHGLENFLGWKELEDAVSRSGIHVIEHIGFHPWPFQLPGKKTLHWVDLRNETTAWARCMINQAILGIKR